MKDIVRKPNDADDRLKKVESKKFQRLTSNKMFFQGEDDSTIQFEMAMVMDICKSTIGVMARLMRAVGHCNVKPMLSCRLMLANHSLMPRLIVDADSVSAESTRKSLHRAKPSSTC